MILLAGYHTTSSSPGPRSAQDVQKSRLLYCAYVLEQDLSLRSGKPPLLNERMIACLPNERPEDCQTIVCSPEGTTVNYLRERLILARIQNRAWKALRSPMSSTITSKEFLINTSQLLGELEQWNKSLPTSIRPPEMPAEPGTLKHIQLTDINWSYFQTVVVIHSAIFSHPPLFSDPAIRDQAGVAVGECAGAVRKMLALAKRVEQSRSLLP